MTPERFNALIDAYGGDPAHWPEAERDAALAYAKTTPAARVALDEAVRLDALIGAMRVDAPAVEVAKIAAAAARLPQEAAASVLPFKGRGLARPAMVWGRVGALAAAAVCGFVIGIGEPMDGNAGALDLYDAGQVEETTW